MLTRTFSLTNKYTLATIKQGLGPIILGAILLEFPVQYLNYMVRSFDQASKEGIYIPESLRVTTILSLSLFGLLIFGYLMFVVPLVSDVVYRNREENNLLASIKSLTWPLTLETLRAMGKVFVGICLLIIPGIYYYLRYSQVPLVVLFCKPYHEGKVDALKTSAFLTRGYEIPIFFFLTVSSLIMLALEALKDSFPPNETPIVFAGCFIIYLLVQVYFCVASYFMYELLMQEKQAEIK